jgi:hypothetical protein
MKGGIINMTKFTSQEFINKYAHEDIISTLSPEITDAFIDDVCEEVIDFLMTNSTTFSDTNLSEWQQAQLKKAQMERAINILTVGRESSMSDKVISILKTAGFLYKGLC